MNDRQNNQREPTTTITVNRVLVDDFVNTVKKDQARHGTRENKPKLFLESFRVLLEEHGLEPSDKPKFASFWEKVGQLATRYHQPYPEGFGAVDEMVAKTQLDKKIAQLVKEYYHLFCLNDEIEPTLDTTVKGLRAHYENAEMHGI